jgi:phosphoacetylglucosamine mutase
MPSRTLWCVSSSNLGQPKPTFFYVCQQGLPAIPPLIIDCANGVGAQAAAKLAKHLGNTIPFVLHNVSTTTQGALNHDCGADYVKTQQKLPPSLEEHLKPGQRGCSLDGDADRLMYFYRDDKGAFRMLDGDKIGALVAAFIGELADAAGLTAKIKVGIVQTAYANGASTKYLSAVCVLLHQMGVLLLMPSLESTRGLRANRRQALASQSREF